MKWFDQPTVIRRVRMNLESDESMAKAHRQKAWGTGLGIAAYLPFTVAGAFLDWLWLPGMMVLGWVAWFAVFVKFARKADKVLDRYVECRCEVHTSPDETSISFRIIKADDPKAERLN